MERKEIIGKILQGYRAGEEAVEQPTFLEIIGKTKHEDYITDLLVYALKTDAFILEQLVQKFYGESEDFCDIIIEEIVSQKYMEEEGRADIFIIAETGQGNRCVVIIENKTDTVEHSNQTTKYARWAESHYSDHQKYLFFLKPDYNQGKAADKQYKIVNYSQLAPLLGGSKNVYIADLKRHIEKYLTEKEIKFMEHEKLVLENYNELKTILDSVERKLINGRRELIKKLQEDGTNGITGFQGGTWKGKDNAKEDEIILWETDSKMTFHFFKKEWYREDKANFGNEFYFYAEIKFIDNTGCNIVCQKTVRTKRKQENKNLKVFLKGKGIEKTPENFNGCDYTILSACSFKSEKEVYSLEWWQELREFSIINLNRYLRELDSLTKEFFEWDKNQQ